MPGQPPRPGPQLGYITVPYTVGLLPGQAHREQSYFGVWSGENSDWPADAIHPGELSGTADMFHRGMDLARRDGQFREPNVSASAGGTSIVAGVAADFSFGQKLIVQGSNGQLYATSSGMTTWTNVIASAFNTPVTFALLGDVLAVCTEGGTLLGCSGAASWLSAFGIAAAAPLSRFALSYKNRLWAAGHDASADEVKYTAIGATTGLPTPGDWSTVNNAGNRIFSQGDGNRLVGLAAAGNVWYAFKRERTLAVTGDTPSSFVTVAADLEAGFYHRSIANVGRGLVGCNEDGIHSLINGKIEPLLPNRLRDYWKALNLANVSAFQGAWSASRDQYRLMVQNGSSGWEMLTAVLEPQKPIAFYRWPGVPARCLFSRLVSGNKRDFYRGGNADGFLYRMDQVGPGLSSQDASANLTSNFTTGILDDGKPWLDKRFLRAWVFGRTRGPWNASCTFQVHGEGGKPTTITGYRPLSLAAAGGDIKRGTFHLDGQYGWGISVRVDFDPTFQSSIHKLVIEYEPQQTGVPVV